MRRKMKGVESMFGMLVAMAGVGLAILILFMVYGMASKNLTTVGPVVATGQWVVPPSGTSTPRAVITIKAGSSVTIKSNPVCYNSNSVQLTVSNPKWNIADRTTSVNPPFTLNVGQSASVTFQLSGGVTSVVYCTIDTSQGTLNVQIS